MRSWFMLFLVATLILSSCGKKGGGSSSEEATLAITKITTYAQEGKEVPTVQDYINAGVTGINQEECNALNSIILGLSQEAIDSSEELQALLDDYYTVLETKPLPASTPQPSIMPTSTPSVEPTQEPTPKPSSEPTIQPTLNPIAPMPTPTPQPSVAPNPTPTPTLQPSVTPTLSPTPTPNNAPVVDAGADQSIELGQSVTLTATANDSDGDSMSYKWSESGSVLATTLSFEYTPSSDGNHTLAFMATDENNASANDSVTVEVTQECDPFSQFVGAC